MRVRITASIIGTSTARSRTRSAFFAKRGSRGPFRLACRLAEFRELRIVADGEDHVAVGARERLVRHDVRMRVAEARRRRAGHEVVEVHHRHHRDRRIEQAGVQMLALAGALAVRERGQDAGRREQACDQIGDRNARLLRSAAGHVVGLAGDAHEPGHALDDEVVAGALGVGSGLAESGDRAIDDARIRFRDVRVVEPVLREPADLEVLDEHVRVARQRHHDRLTFGLREVDGDRKLAAIAAEVVRGLGRVAALRVLQVRRSPGTRVVTGAGSLDLPDRRAEVGEVLRAPRSREDAGEIEDGEVGKRSGHGELGTRTRRDYRLLPVARCNRSR